MICINNSDIVDIKLPSLRIFKCEAYLTINKQYDVSDAGVFDFRLVYDDMNRFNYYESCRFVSIKEYRRMKLKKLLEY